MLMVGVFDTRGLGEWGEDWANSRGYESDGAVSARGEEVYKGAVNGLGWGCRKRRMGAVSLCMFFGKW